MIPADENSLHIAWLPPASIVVGADHDVPMNEAQILLYLHLLRDDPSQATDPIIVRQAGPVYVVTNGRHRLLANIIAGRERIAALVVGGG